MFLSTEAAVYHIKKSYIARSRSSTSTNSKNKVICNNSFQLRVVNFSAVISSSILDVGRGPGPASYKYGISCQLLRSITLYGSRLQRRFENIICYSVWEKTCFEKYIFVEIKMSISK